MKNKIHLKREQKFVIILIILLVYNILCGFYNYRKVALHNLEQIENTILYTYSGYMRNKIYYKKDLHEVGQLLMSLNGVINNVQSYSKKNDVVPCNSMKAIDCVDSAFEWFSFPDEKVDEYFEKMDKLWMVLNNAIQDAKYGDITNKNYIRIKKAVDEIKQLSN